MAEIINDPFYGKMLIGLIILGFLIATVYKLTEKE